MNWKGCGRKLQCSNLIRTYTQRHLPRSIQNISTHVREPGRNLNPYLQKYEAESYSHSYYKRFNVYCICYVTAKRPGICNINEILQFSFLCYLGSIWRSCRSQWPRGRRRRSAAARLLRSWVRITPGAWMFVCCECCVLSGRRLWDELITRPEESYRLWCVVVCDLETSRIGAPYIYDISSLRVNVHVRFP